jgi:formylglycine-generating enzyme
MQITSTASKASKYLSRPPGKDMVWMPGDTFLMGSARHCSEEAPTHKVAINGFWIDKYLVTNAQFQKFVKATGYVTFAERLLFSSLFAELFKFKSVWSI